MSNLTRREFIVRSAQAAALASIVAGSTTGFKAMEGGGESDLKWHKAPCRYCGTGCGTLVGIKEGRAVAVQGDKQCEVNAGLLCVKGYNAGALHYGKDRLTHPMIRKNGKLEKSSWDEALDLIAAKIVEDPARFSIYGSGQWTIVEGYTAMKFMKGGLSNNHIDPNARLCMASAVVGFITTFGVDEPSGCYDDLDECDTVLTWGNNWAEMHPILYSRFIDRKNEGHKINYIDLGTRRTRSSNAADHYLEFIPQTDMVIANCIAFQLLDRGTYDKEFVAKNVSFKDDKGKNITLEQYQEFLKDYSVEKASALSGVPENQLKLLGDVFSDPERKVVSLWCMGVNQHTRGTAMNNLIYNVHLLSGKICKPGSTPFSLTGQPSACGTCREVGTLAHALPGGRVVANEGHRKDVEDVWKTRPGAINPKPGFHTMAMFKALVKGDLTGMWVQVTNPAQTIPDLNANVKKIKDKFMVVSDIYPTLTTKIADVVLPSAAWLEKNGVFGNSERRTHQWFKMIEPAGESRDDVWQMIAVARKLYDLGVPGMKNRDGEFLFSMKDENGKEIKAWIWEEFQNNNVDKILFSEYRPLTFKKHKNVAPYDELVKVPGMRWPVVEKGEGVWMETRRRFVEGEDPFVEKGKGVQFYHAKAGDDKALIWARPYEAPPEVPDKEYPFWLCTGRVVEHWHTGTMTRRVPQLNKAMPEAYVEIRSEDAKALHIKTGDMVKVSSRRGEGNYKAWIGGRAIPQKGLVFIPFFDENKVVNTITLDEYCPKSKEPDYKKCAVKLEKVQ